MTTVADVHKLLFKRYRNIIEAEGCYIDDEFYDDDRLSLANLTWMCEIGESMIASMPDDKAGRWIGFIQCGLAMRLLITVDGERDFTRPLFRAAYETANQETVSLERDAE